MTIAHSEGHPGTTGKAAPAPGRQRGQHGYQNSCVRPAPRTSRRKSFAAHWRWVGDDIIGVGGKTTMAGLAVRKKSVCGIRRRKCG